MASYETRITFRGDGHYARPEAMTFIPKLQSAGVHVVTENSRISTVKKLRSALEAAGVVFIAENGGGAGVRFHETKTRKQTEA